MRITITCLALALALACDGGGEGETTSTPTTGDVGPRCVEPRFDSLDTVEHCGCGPLSEFAQHCSGYCAYGEKGGVVTGSICLQDCTNLPCDPKAGVSMVCNERGVCVAAGACPAGMRKAFYIGLPYVPQEYCVYDLYEE